MKGRDRMAANQALINGRHVTLMLVGFFGVIIAVNITMAHLARSSFGGTVVDNSYVASQTFNHWLAQARAQARLGWATPVMLDAHRHVVISVPGAGFAASAVAQHPLGRADDVALAFVADGRGRLVSTTALPGGRWHLRLTIRNGEQTKRLLETLS
jgi:nitrogen fixation protein FixH